MEGKVGPFFYINKKIFSDSISSEKANNYGEFKNWGSHSKFWDLLSSQYPYFKKIEYYICPRGRVSYNTKQKTYVIFLNEKLNSDFIVKQIIVEFNLQGSNYIIDDNDEHYQTE